MAEVANIRVRSLADGTAPVESTFALASGACVTVGRHGDLIVGVDPEDSGLSRRSLTVTLAEDHWSLTTINSNGAVVHPWGQASRWAERNVVTVMPWPLVGVRLIGTQPGLQHWVLLEAPFDQRSVAPRDDENTSLVDPPPPLTGLQLDAVRTVFAQHLAWPPIAAPSPVPLQAAAGRLLVSPAAIYQRLEAARNRAYQLGAPTQIGVSDPEYIYTLVRAGVIPVSPRTA